MKFFANGIFVLGMFIVLALPMFVHFGVYMREPRDVAYFGKHPQVDSVRPLITLYVCHIPGCNGVGRARLNKETLDGNGTCDRCGNVAFVSYLEERSTPWD